MEISLVGRQPGLAKPEAVPLRNPGLCGPSRFGYKPNRLGFRLGKPSCERLGSCGAAARAGCRREKTGPTSKPDITVGLGPDGELRYPSFPPSDGSHSSTGAGEFQRYDRYMLAQLKQHAEASGYPNWALADPHDGPTYTQPPNSAPFFDERGGGGSWEKPYGDFFLSWYSAQLLAHADRLLSTAANSFAGLPARLTAKVPLLHGWHATRSRAPQLTAGFYNTDGGDGYGPVAEVFARHVCTMVVPGMELAGVEEPESLRSNPETLLAEITAACERHGVAVVGENASLDGGAAGFSRMKERCSTLSAFTYQRMGTDFFAPEHFRLFTEFARSLVQSELDSEDIVGSEEEAVCLPMSCLKGSSDREMQAV